MNQLRQKRIPSGRFNSSMVEELSNIANKLSQPGNTSQPQQKIVNDPLSFLPDQSQQPSPTQYDGSGFRVSQFRGQSFKLEARPVSFMPNGNSSKGDSNSNQKDEEAENNLPYFSNSSQWRGQIKKNSKKDFELDKAIDDSKDRTLKQRPDVQISGMSLIRRKQIHKLFSQEGPMLEYGDDSQPARLLIRKKSKMSTQFRSQMVESPTKGGYNPALKQVSAQAKMTMHIMKADDDEEQEEENEMLLEDESSDEEKKTGTAKGSKRSRKSSHSDSVKLPAPANNPVFLIAIKQPQMRISEADDLAEASPTPRKQIPQIQEMRLSDESESDESVDGIDCTQEESAEKTINTIERDAQFQELRASSCSSIDDFPKTKDSTKFDARGGFFLNTINHMSSSCVNPDLDKSRINEAMFEELLLDESTSELPKAKNSDTSIAFSINECDYQSNKRFMCRFILRHNLS
ncbi:hypothetical protein FGO68_gene5919 [Halteria grandinella]|uniref:Uncharacterized protein n=1 Tax=Halteria grandinella TaxID=5974 RepID=A0A8J8P024_HALGN|nr:hypothetical protein FGO68_gene5919 [Halteria grandinella]